MNAPDPKANTTTEAYLAYKAGYLEESELKPVLYEPYLHFDGWLAYWAGLTTTYPIKNVGKNLFDADYYENATYTTGTYEYVKTNFAAGKTYTFTAQLKPGKTAISGLYVYISTASNPNSAPESQRMAAIYNGSTTASAKTSSIPSGETLYFQFYPTTTDITQLFDTYDFQLEYGSSATPYEPYSGEPEMLCDEEALVAYLSGVTDTYPEEIKDPYDVRITGYLRYLCSYRFGRPEYPVTNSEFYLSLLDAPHTSNETPSADIELDTSEGKLIDVKAYGDTTQETLTGKNLLATNLDTLKYINTLGTWTNNVYVYNGITYTVNDDLTIDVNGSTAENAPSYFIINNTLSLTASTDYILNGCPPDGAVTSYSIRLYDSGVYTSDIGNGLSFTYGTQNLVRINIFGGITVTNKLFKPMIRLATVTDDTYEKFVGGIPSPNPDYPQDIQVVTGEQTVKVTGKNLLPITMASQTLNGVTYTVNDDKSITMSGTASSRSEPRLYQAVPGAPTVVLKAGVTYHNSTGTILYWYSSNYHTVVPGGNYTPVADELIQFAFVRVENGETVDTTIYPQLEQGSTATTYEPYQSQDYKVNLGKNLFDKDNATLLEAYFDGSHTSLTGASTNRTAYLKVKPNTTYTISKLLSVRNFIGITQTEPAVGTSVSNIANMGNGYYDGVTRVSGTLTTGPNDNYIVVNYTNINSETGDIPTNILNSIQIEEGSTATSFAPYFTPIELCRLANPSSATSKWQDYIYRDNGDWYIHKEIEKIVYNGSENWSLYGDYSYAVDFPRIMDWGMTDKFTVLGYSDFVNENKLGFYATYSLRLYLVFPNEEHNLDTLKNWLSNNNLTGYFAYRQYSTNIKITNSTLISQLEALAGAGTYNEKTFIKVTANDPNLPALLKVEAYKY